MNKDNPFSPKCAFCGVKHSIFNFCKSVDRERKREQMDKEKEEALFAQTNALLARAKSWIKDYDGKWPENVSEEEAMAFYMQGYVDAQNIIWYAMHERLQQAVFEDPLALAAEQKGEK